ncbi:MAG: hypothetical protein PHT91_03575 [Candidatus Nanoarchaeia archaeon]|nr:hypothetical protein [Candidatus Nanoarchaeia archaeon]MDD5054119.1 hypothetical protein [Candidatus Nanoarchaeia archaeon]MDD5499924.1 hypothetical protein [Candidatus Nanoarchaeia archaeon]
MGLNDFMRKKTLTEIIYNEQKKIAGPEQANIIANFLNFYVTKAMGQELIEPENQLEYKLLFYDCFKIIKERVKPSDLKLEWDIIQKYLSLNGEIKQDMEKSLNGDLSLAINSRIDRHLMDKKNKAKKPSSAWQFSSLVVNVLINKGYIHAQHENQKNKIQEIIKHMYS